MAETGKGYRYNRHSELPQLRESPYAADAYDKERAEYNKRLWCSMDDLLRPRDRQIEENVRMLLGQHWIVWSEMRGRFVNLLEQMPDDERRWRHMPVLNRLFLWYVLLHARMTENPPVLSWQPGPDRIDQQLAEVCDALFKYTWRETQMLEVIDRLISWMIPAGRAHLKSRVDPTKGDPIPQRAPAHLELLNPRGQQILGPDGEPIRRLVNDVPYAPGKKGGEYVPAMRAIAADPENPDAFELQAAPGLEPELLYEGGIEVDVVSAPEVRGSWGQHVPWHKKAMHIQKVLLTPLEFYEAFGVEVEPDVRGHEAENSGVLFRLLQGGGLFGAADSKREEPGTQQEFVTVYESWHRPGRMKGTERTEESPGGRLLITTEGGIVIRDGVRPAAFRYTSPIRTFDFVNLPGRPSGTSPQEFLNGPVRTRNRLFAQKLGHATLAANPIRVLDSSQGLEEGQVPNTPGAEILADRSKSDKPPVEYISVPAMGSDVDDAADRLRAEIDQIGQIAGTEATPPTQDSSGELIKELRFNSDRPIAATMRRMVVELGRMAEDWLALGAIVYDQPKVISITGEDAIARTIELFPELFTEGNVNVEPEIESMLPEGRGERQARAEKFFDKGVFGDPRSQQAVMAFLDVSRFPHMSQLHRPGGADRATAEQNVGKLLQGTTAAAIPVYPWYDHALHRWVLEQFMKSPEYLKRPLPQQTQFVAFWQKLIDGAAAAQLLLSERTMAAAAEAEATKLTHQAALLPLVNAVTPPQPTKPGERSEFGAPDAGATSGAPGAVRSPTPSTAVA